MRATDELIHGIVLCSQIPSVKRQRDIERELRAHIEDFAEAAREAGHQEHEIEALLLTHFGDPGRVAKEFAWVYRHERRRLRTLAYVVSTLMIASSLLLALLTIQSGLAAIFGTPILRLLASKHTVIEGLDVLSCVAVYLAVTALEGLFEEHRFPKAVLLLMGLIGVSFAVCIAMQFHAAFLVYGLVAGISLRSARLFVSARITRASIVLFCFGSAGLAFALLRSKASVAETVATCASWIAVGAGYLVMTEVAPGVDAGLRSALQRI